MMYDFQFLRRGEVPPIVIVGSGPAGITLAKTLSERGLTSLVLEAGGLDWTDKVQETARGEVIGDEYWELEYSHLKYFGGSSNHWGGRCRPLDEVDFLERDDLDEHRGWPIRKSDLDIHQAEANAILEVPQVGEIVLDEYVKEIEFVDSPPVVFSEKYRDLFEKSPRANVCLNSNVIALNAKDGRVSSIDVAGLDGDVVTIEPETIVICMGGIDNSRLLLWSNEMSPEPVVPQPDCLGRYWMEHPHNIAGDVKLFEPIARFSHPWDISFFAPTERALSEFHILNAHVRFLHGLNYKNPAPRNLKELTRDIVCDSSLLTDVIETSLDKGLGCATVVEIAWEQEARGENRIEISQTEKDAFGVPRPVLYWKKSPLDYRTAKVAMELVGRYLAENGYGALRSFDHIIKAEFHPVVGWVAGNHHMGGTRMAERPDLGIVDRNLKIFGMENAYVLGSSVFPSGGHANPTYTIVQLAIRLGHHLAAQSH